VVWDFECGGIVADILIIATEESKGSPNEDLEDDDDLK